MISSLIHGFRVFQELVVEDSQKHDQQEQYRSQCGAVSHSPVGKALLIHVYCRNHRGCSRTAFCQDKYYVKNLQRIDDRQSDHQLDLAGPASEDRCSGFSGKGLRRPDQPPQKGLSESTAALQSRAGKAFRPGKPSPTKENQQPKWNPVLSSRFQARAAPVKKVRCLSEGVQHTCNLHLKSISITG